MNISREIPIFGLREGRAWFEEDHTAHVEGSRGRVNVRHRVVKIFRDRNMSRFWCLRPDLDTKMSTQNTKSRADAQWSIIQMARRTGFREQYYTGTRKYSAGKVAGRKVKKLYKKW